MMLSYFRINFGQNKISYSAEKGFGLDPSNVVVENFPLDKENLCVVMNFRPFKIHG
jgi:hypothetical protein